MRAQSIGGLARGRWIVLLSAAMLILPSTALGKSAGGALSPRLAKLASPGLRDASPGQQAHAVGLTADGLARRGRRLLATVRFDKGALAARDELRAAGAKTLAASASNQLVTVAVTPAQLQAVAKVPGVKGVTPVHSPVAAEVKCPSGEIVSEGDTQLKAEAAREDNPGIDGSGVKVGILSDSFDQANESGQGGPIATHAAQDVESADLPGANGCANASPVAVLSPMNDGAEASDEGRAMAQIVHDLAPGAELAFASAFNGEPAFAKGIEDLADAGAKVIADDVFYLEEPFFQDGPVAVAVNKAVEDGVSYFSAAGNNSLIDKEGHDIASWETPKFRDAGACPPAVRAVSALNPFHCLDFNPGLAVDKTFGIEVKPGATLAVDLQWDEPWFGVNTDLDAFLLNASGNRIAESHEDNIEVSKMPVEILEWENTSSSPRTVQLVVNRFAGGDPRLKFALLENGGGVSATEYPRSSGEDVVGPTIFGHSGAASAISVGAVFRQEVKGRTTLEPYSSAGPVIHDYGPVEGSSPAAPIAEETISKPDLVATDCVRTTFFADFESGFWRFCGTSAAAPHAAAVAALMLDRAPGAEPGEVRNALTASATKPIGLGLYSSCEVGVGLIDAVGALEAVVAKAAGKTPSCKRPKSEVGPEEAQAPGEWGSEIPPPTPPPSGGGSTPPPSTPEETLPPVTPRPPRTRILQHPLKVIRTTQHRALAVFRFGSNESDVSFVCRIDGGAFRPCPERLARRFPPGWHLLQVAARNAEGVGDRSPARYRFKVKTIR